MHSVFFRVRIWGTSVFHSAGWVMKRNKHGNRPIVIDGIKFQSTKEGRRYLELKLLQKTGYISNLKLQPKFLICEALKKDPVTGRRAQARTYSADFQYIEKGVEVVEDVKGGSTKKDPTYRLKRHIFLSLYGHKYEFREV